MPLVVMGVSGSGKSTVAAAVAARVGRVFLDADDFHPHRTSPRWPPGCRSPTRIGCPGSIAVGDEVARRAADGDEVVLACSALKRSYRDLLRESAGDLFFAHLDGIARAARRAHRRPRRPLHAEQPARSRSWRRSSRCDPTSAGVVVDIAGSPHAIVDAVVAAWPRRASGGG